MRSSSRSATGDFEPEDFPDGFPGACPALARDFPALLAGSPLPLPLPFRFVSLSALATAHPFPSGPSIVRRTGRLRYRCQGPVTAKVVPGV